MNNDNKAQYLFAETKITTFEEFIGALNLLLKQIETDKELPENSLYVRENLSSKEKKLTSWSICIREPYYPAPYGDDKYDNQIEVVVTFSKKDLAKEGLSCTCSIKQDVLDKVGIVGSPKILSGSVTASKTIRYLVNDSCLFVFMEKLVRHAIEHYLSPENPFGCCSRYMQCSDAKKCVHPNKLYSTACAYRHNLEHGRIFYGKNKNIGLEEQK